MADLIRPLTQPLTRPLSFPLDARGDLGTGGVSSAFSRWILFSGVWDDAGIWQDERPWASTSLFMNGLYWWDGGVWDDARVWGS